MQFSMVAEPVVKQNVVSAGFSDTQATIMMDMVKALMENKLNEVVKTMENFLEALHNKLVNSDTQLQNKISDLGTALHDQTAANAAINQAVRAIESDIRDVRAANINVHSKVNIEVTKRTHDLRQLADALQVKMGAFEAWQRNQDVKLNYLNDVANFSEIAKMMDHIGNMTINHDAVIQQMQGDVNSYNQQLSALEVEVRDAKRQAQFTSSWILGVM